MKTALFASPARRSELAAIAAMLLGSALVAGCGRSQNTATAPAAHQASASGYGTLKVTSEQQAAKQQGEQIGAVMQAAAVAEGQ